MIPIHSSGALIERAIAFAREGRRKTVAVAAAQDADVIEAAAQCRAAGMIEAVLIGDEAKIRALAREHGLDLGGCEIVHMPDPGQAAHCAARLASERRADAIMKGFLPTSALLKVVLDKAYDLRGPNTLSHCAVLDIPGYHKLLNLTDGGMVVKPEPDQKLQILENAVRVGRALGLAPVKVAVSGATETPGEGAPQRLSDLDYVIPRAVERFRDVVIQGPLTLDAAMSKEAAERHGMAGEVVGDADVFLVDTIEECNVVAKALVNFAGAVFAGVIVGAKAPVSLVSRTDTATNKKASLAIACLLADYYAQQGVWES
ncbi:MAG: phosphate acyltransferase [candidate division Zixibacteria bacterium]|nr:phosphate acyltransferase [candidate division Zixibacteria bacterium]